MWYRGKLVGETLCPFILVGIVGIAQAAKSVYVVSDTITSQLRAYKVEDTNLVYQTNYVCQSDTPGGTGAVGIAIDESNYGEFLFVTFENQRVIELVDAKTMQYVDAVMATGASNLAGIVVDSINSKVYVMDRYTNQLFSYSWDPSTRTVTPDFSDPYYIELQGMQYGSPKGAFGIALDEANSRLYVADNTTDIKYYDINDWSKLGQIAVSCQAIGVAIDVQSQLLYYGSMGSYGEGDTHLYQYNISAQTEDSVVVGSSVGGIAVDQETSLVYVTTYHDGGTDTQDRQHGFLCHEEHEGS